MSYGGQSNAPWQRNVMQGHPQGGYNQGSQMYMPNVQQTNMAAFSHGSGSGGNIFPGGGNSVSYPQPRSGLNPVAFQQGGSSNTHYNSIGTVTKMSNDCGLVNDEVFFYRNVCKGQEPKLGDRVIFEASCSNNGQFKWDATRIQLMQAPQPLITSNKNNYSAVAPPNEYQRSQVRRHSPKRSPVRGRQDRDNRNKERLHRSRDRDEVEHERKRRREERSPDRAPVAKNRSAVGANEGRSGNAARIESERDRAESKKKDREMAVRDRDDRVRERPRERTREREVNRAGPIVRRGRAARRYMVKMPKTLLSIKTADVQELRQRYNSLYIPSDFFHANIKWTDTFTPDKPFSLRRPCQFHIMHELVESPIEQKNELLEPADANYLYSAKVMLMSLPTIAEIYKKCFDNADDDDDHHAVHPTRLINFLVGVKGRVGSMAIGGPWSPSLDGENPDKDPSVLIRTAIRTCKALIGVDLSNCTQWYRFVELYYHRTEYKNMEKDGPPRVETVVIYLPDVHSCMPSLEEWQTLTQTYKNAADGIIAHRLALVAAAAANSNDDNDNNQDVEMAHNSIVADEGVGEEPKEEAADNDENCAENDGENAEDLQEEDEPEENMNVSTASDAAEDNAEGDDDDDDADAGADDGLVAEDTTAANDENDEPPPEPTHYSLLDLKTMKVQEIRDELLARNLPDTGVRNVIMARLAKALNTEKTLESASKNKGKKQKTVAVEKSNEEDMDVDSESPTSKAAVKNSVTENKNKNEKRNAKESNGNVKLAKSSGRKKSTSNAKKENVNEKEEDWADFELSDIVILDEYDSSKNVDETKEMSEKEKARLIRHHTLPPTPHIVVHPNKEAKEGKFDCAVMSLSALLDYHPDDSKERFFEVSLFAELFNEMLIRDFGFNIYKEFYLYDESTNAGSVCENADIIKAEGDDNKIEKTENGDEIKKDCKENDNEKEKSIHKEKKSSNEEKSGKEQHNDDLQSIKAESRKRKISTSNSIANGNEHLLVASGKKMVVVKPQLLLSFVYFDTTYCGYIYDKHLEELFYVLGLNLSRSQIKNLLGKFRNMALGQSIFYRKLTDREASLDSTPAIEDIDDLPFDEYKRIAAGNNHYEAVFGRKTVQDHVSAIEGDDSKEGLINFNGTIVHVGKLLNQINRTEKNYSDLEKLHNDLLKQHNDLQKDHNKTNTKIKDLQSEIKSVSRKLTDANQDFYSLNRKYRDEHSTLSYIYTRVEPYFSKEKDKDKDVKSEGSRDKEKNDKEKENGKSKDKECEKEKSKDEKEKSKNEKEKPKDEKEKSKDEKEKSKDEKEKVIKKENNKNKEKLKDDNEKQVVKDAKVEEEKHKITDVKEKQQEKVVDVKENVKENVKDNKEKDQTKSDKEKHKDDLPKDKAKEDKEKQTVKVDKIKQTPQKAVVQKPKPITPAAKKPTGGTKPPVKIVKKSENPATTKK